MRAVLRPGVLASLLAGAIAFLPGCVASRVNREALHPDAYFAVIPGDLGLEGESFTVDADGDPIHGWFFPSPGARSAVVVFGGNTGNKSLFLPLARGIRDGGHHVVLFDYRGFGLSGGEPDLWSLVPDGIRVIEAVRARADVERVGLVGISLGSVVALAVAAREPDGVDAVAVEGLFDPPRKLREMLGGFLAWLGRPFLIPSGWTPGDQLESLEVPILCMHGTEDRITPLAQAAPLFARGLEAPAPRTFWIAEGAGHAPGIAGAYGPAYVERLLLFFEAALRSGSVPDALRARWQVTSDEEDPRLEVAIDGIPPRLEETAPETLPVEVAVVGEDGGTAFQRFRVGRGIDRVNLSLALPLASTGGPQGEPVLVAPSVPPISSIRDHPEGWEPDSAYRRSRVAWDAFEPYVYDRLGFGQLLRAAGVKIVIRVDEPPGDEVMLERCREVSARLTAILARDVHPWIRPKYAEIWLALAERWVALGKAEEGDAAYEQALRLRPERPASFWWFGDADWELGPDFGKLALACDQLARLARGDEERERWETRAAAWTRLAEARASAVRDWEAGERRRAGLTPVSGRGTP